jgi:hypothetical protein
MQNNDKIYGVLYNLKQGLKKLIWGNEGFTIAAYAPPSHLNSVN